MSQTARSSESETVAMLQGGITDQAPFREKANRALDPEEASSSRNKVSNSLRRAILSRRGFYSKELPKPAMPPLRWRWARRTIPTCSRS